MRRGCFEGLLCREMIGETVKRMSFHRSSSVEACKRYLQKLGLPKIPLLPKKSELPPKIFKGGAAAPHLPARTPPGPYPYPGDLVTSWRETGEKILLPYPIRQPARSRKFAVVITAVTARVIEC